MSAWKMDSTCKYTTTDEWIRVTNGQAFVGISDYAQDKLSDIVYVEFPAVSTVFKKGDVFGVVESVKAAADLKLPMSGEVVEVNTKLEDAPELVNDDPYGAAWIIKISVADPSELELLMDSDAYEAYCTERG